MLRDKLAAAMLVAILAVGYCHDAKAEGLPKSGLLPIGEVAKAGSWSGLYIGGHVGYGWGEWNGPLSYDDHNPNWPQPLLAFDGSDRTIKGDNLLGGLQVGLMHQMGSWVAGIEADISWTEIDGFGSFMPYPNNPGSPAWDIKTKLDMMGTVRGRLGYATGSVLTYATAGFAWAQTESSIQPMYGPISNGLATSDHIHVGWTVGGGIEWALSSSWTMRAEYLYVNLGRMDYAYDGKTAGGQPYDTDHYHADLDLHTVRLGINYRFGAK